MCIAILNTKQANKLSSTTVYNSWENNNMGGGLLWNKQGKLHHFKTYDYDEFYNKYEDIRKDKKVENVVLHFRIATSGVDGIHNLHPFIVNDDLGFVHNGVIGGLGNKEFSDTHEFNEILKGFSHDFVNCQTTKSFIEEYISYSKLIFLRSNGEYDIFNEHLGHWSDGNWYSNDSYKAVNSWVYAGSKKVNKTHSIKSKELFSMALFDSKMLTDFEHEMFIELCEYFGIDPTEEETNEIIEELMYEYNAIDIYALYDAIMYVDMKDYNNSFYNERWSDDTIPF